MNTIAIAKPEVVETRATEEAFSLPSHVRASALTVDDTRGHYGELNGKGTFAIMQFLAPCLPGAYASFDSKSKGGRGQSLNLDLYAWDPEQAVGIVQLRHARRKKYDGYLNVRKSYVLCGFNENGTAFRHPVWPAVIHGAVRRGLSPAGVVQAVQCRMWGVTPRLLVDSVRQGDVLVVPERCRSLDREKLDEKWYLKEIPAGDFDLGSHVVSSAEPMLGLRETEHGGVIRVLAKHPVVRHSKGEHATTRAPRAENHGWYSVRMAGEDAAWSFASRDGD
ncbi:hypothetical protein [Gluconacetobacter tumulicola]|uniref:Uncharacterized protein n=1 Tax=Gluconacetobacter tumulicola TaxID=1017177 RepID=A0A7W4JF67_9PROT|nr:hypothetical protein [Gluconacetobacter tumulicola]MBB2180129.1 hypothetical protein [Gluconacetobacter tumulicola]